jgi:glycosyltransferase involved in cell wall biosynthesis
VKGDLRRETDSMLRPTDEESVQAANGGSNGSHSRAALVASLTSPDADTGTDIARASLLTRATASVVIPTLNEERNVAWVLARLPAGLHEVIIVDGGSTDDTVEIARAVYPRVRVLVERRPGKGAALRAGFAEASGEYVVMLDADGSMNPSEIPRFIWALDNGCDLVKGSRFAPGGGTSDMTAVRRVGNGALMATVNVLYRTSFSDLCYGYMAFRRDRLSALRLDSDGFEIETEMVARAVIAGLRIAEVPSFENERGCGHSHLRPWRDGRRVLNTLLSERFILPRTPVVVPGVAR